VAPGIGGTGRERSQLGAVNPRGSAEARSASQVVYESRRCRGRWFDLVPGDRLCPRNQLPGEVIQRSEAVANPEGRKHTLRSQAPGLTFVGDALIQLVPHQTRRSGHGRIKEARTESALQVAVFG
jgi:hypothetical protein